MIVVVHYMADLSVVWWKARHVVDVVDLEKWSAF